MFTRPGSFGNVTFLMWKCMKTKSENNKNVKRVASTRSVLKRAVDVVSLFMLQEIQIEKLCARGEKNYFERMKIRLRADSSCNSRSASSRKEEKAKILGFLLHASLMINRAESKQQNASLNALQMKHESTILSTAKASTLEQATIHPYG